MSRANCKCPVSLIHCRKCCGCGWVESPFVLLDEGVRENDGGGSIDFLCYECGHTGAHVTDEPLWVEAFDVCGACRKYCGQATIIPCEGEGCHTDSMFHASCMKRVRGYYLCEECLSAGRQPPLSDWEEEEEEEADGERESEKGEANEI